MKNRPTTIALAAVLAAGLTSAFATAATNATLAAQAKITLPQARAKALAAVPGKIAASELEQEAGGSGLRYSFDIATAAGTREVGIDAKTGAVLENSADNAPASQAGGEQKDADGD